MMTGSEIREASEFQDRLESWPIFAVDIAGPFVSTTKAVYSYVVLPHPAIFNFVWIDEARAISAMLAY